MIGTITDRKALLLVNTGRLHNAFGHLFRRSQLRSQKAFALAFAGSGLSPLQFGILELVLLNPGITQGELAEALAAAPPVVTTAMKPLRRDGYLLDEIPADDARCCGYRLSDSGRDFILFYRGRLEQAEALLLAPLSPAERRSLKRLLHKLAAAPRL